MEFINSDLSIRANYQRVKERIARAALSAGREPEDVRLIVVTKGQPLKIVKQAIEAGARTLGENYAQEGVSKILALNGQNSVEWHMIGHIQSRKARLICEHFSFVHTIDSLKLATRLDRFAREIGRQLPVLVECNVSGEKTKFGLAAWNEDNWDELLPFFSNLQTLSHLLMRGLMTIPPISPVPEKARPYFRRLRKLLEFLAKSFPQTQWVDLSMGMSTDFEIAIQEGATLVRVGQAILGPRLAK